MRLARTISFTLRDIVRSGVSRKVFAVCCVIVEPPDCGPPMSLWRI
jgi:hypothetical protein